MNSKKITSLALLLALVWILAALESMLLPLFLLPPHVKPGLANVVTMYTAVSVGRPQAVMLALLKSALVFQIRGPAAGLLSFCGGMLAIAVIILLRKRLADGRVSYGTASITAALSHNLGQFAAASVMVGMPLLPLLPVLLVSGVLMGTLTGTLLKIIMPALRRLP